MSKQSTTGEPVTRPRFRAYFHPAPEVLKHFRAWVKDTKELRRALATMAEALLVESIEEQVKIVIRLEDEDRATLEGEYGADWAESAKCMAWSRVQETAEEIRESARARAVKDALADMGPEHVDAMQARIDELTDGKCVIGPT